MPVFRLRPARPGDAEAVATIWRDGWHDGHLGNVPGVAGLLLAEAERLVAAAGHRHAWPAVVAGNARARRFYERQGWVDEGPFDYAAKVAGGTLAVACHRYAKPVTGSLTAPVQPPAPGGR